MKFILVLFAMFSYAGFAADQEAKGFDLDLVKLACKDPGAVHNQMPPTDLKITCRMQMCEWVEGPSTFSEYPNWKKVCGALMTNKPGIKVPKWCWGLPASPTPYNCPTYVEQMSETEMVFSVTCDEVIGMTSIKDYCASKMSEEIAANESILTVTKTGKSMNVCGTGTPQQK